MALSLFPTAASILVSAEPVLNVSQKHVFLDALPDSAAVANTAAGAVELHPSAPVSTEPRIRRGKKRCANERNALERDAYVTALKTVGVSPCDWYDRSEKKEPLTREEQWLHALRAWASRMAR